MSVHLEAARAVKELSLHHAGCLVFYSGGKDSTAVMDLCCRHFSRVVGVFMYLVPGLSVAEERLDFARRRWGVELLLTPHWVLSGLLRQGVYGVPDRSIPKVTLPAVVAHARQATGLQLVAHGGKRSDGLWRRRQMKATADPHVIYPVAKWNKWDVLGYLGLQGVECPQKFDVELSVGFLLKLKAKYPDDYRRVCDAFPFAEAAAWRKEWYGVGQAED